MRPHLERHRTDRLGWLRAAVLGANDGIISTASLVIGVAAAQASRSDLLVAGMAGMVAGAMSMATGEYSLGQLAGGYRTGRPRAGATSSSNTTSSSNATSSPQSMSGAGSTLIWRAGLPIS